MRFESPWALLLLVVALAAGYAAWRWQTQATLRYSSTALLAPVGASWRQRTLWLPEMLRTLALCLLVIALARPQEGLEKVRQATEGVAIAMTVDRSGSMGAEMRYGGERMTRLDAVKRVFAEFVEGNRGNLEGRPSDLIGLVSFARWPETNCPLTLAHDALEEFLGAIKLPKYREEDGTAIGDAIALAAARLRNAEQDVAMQRRETGSDYRLKSKVIILLTDGVHNAGERNPLEAAALCKEWGIKVYTIGIGEPEGPGGGSVIQQMVQRMRGPQLDERTLKAVADATGGAYFLATDADSLRRVYAEIDALEKTEIQAERYLDYRERFVPFALAALGLLVLEAALRATAYRTAP
jgi:Ca-activated chloride channel family protein